ncbi:POT family-domain-containing protein, partial [Massariosphaeria phaeospora]
ELRLVRDGVPMRLWVVAVIGFWERAAFWGLTAPWQNYMQHCPFSGPEHPSGALCLGQATATRAYCAFYIFYYISPLLVAVVSDTFLGRYKTLCISVFLFNCGCAALTITSLPRYIFEGWGVLGLILAMGLIGLGGGGFRAVMVPFIADQYVESPPTLKTLKSGEQVVTNRALTLQYIYNLFYWVGNLGSLSWFATVFIENRYGFTLAYLITWVFMFIAMMMLFAGGKWYVKIPLEGNVLPKATKIMLCASKHRFKMERAEPAYQLEHYNRTVAWSSRLVNELTRGLKACRVLLAFIVFYVCFDQMQNNLVSQAGQMKTYDIPNDMMPAMNQVACILLGPIIQEGLYPFLHRRKIYIQPITRITIGFAFVSLSMLYATVVQHFVYSARPCYEHAGECPAMGPQFRPNEINVWIQTPIYFLIAAGEIFAYVTGLEFAYDHSPKDMKAIIQAVNLLLAGIGSMFALALTPIAHNPYLIILYACLTAAMTVTTIAFWLIFRKYDQT